MTTLTRPLMTAGASPMIKHEPDADNPGGQIETRTFIAYLSPDQALAAGHWESDPGRYRTVSDRWECFTILSGRCVVTVDDGTATEYGPGESGIIEHGFTGYWTTLEPLRKSWVVRR